jgi:hypothetical protein
VACCLNHFTNGGVVNEACYPYTAGDQKCSNLCSDWNNRLIKIASWHSMTSTTDMKNWISNKGPLVTCFTVYGDFYAYTNGIYSHVQGNVAGGHCVSVVGHNDTEQYWICKSGWGIGWGESGFFRIACGWVRCLYLDLLNREPDQGGFNNWLNAINGGTSILLVTDGFLRSDEYCTIVANSFYNQLLDRQSDPGGLNAWKDFLVKGKSIQDAIVGFYDGLEFKSKHPIPSQFVESLQ